METCDAVQTDSLFADPWCSSTVGNCNRFEQSSGFAQDGAVFQSGTIVEKYSSLAKFDSLNPTEKIEFLRGLLELAHIRALKDDVPGSLALLNWAEGRKDPYQRAIACVKYAEILLDLDEFERANAYLKNADEIIGKRATEEDIRILRK